MKNRSNKVAVIGYFGFENNQLDGQTVKTRNVLSLLEEYAPDSKVCYFDTQTLRRNKFGFFTMLLRVIQCNRILYLPAYNNLTYFFPIIFFLSRLSGSKIAYIVIGGWLADFLKNKSFHKYLLSKVSLILPENQNVAAILRNEFGFNNVKLLHNFRLNDKVQSERPAQDGDMLKLVFMARVNKQKGLEDIFYMYRELVSDYGDGLRLKIDFYGQLKPEDSDYFMGEVEKYKDISYRGPLAPEDIVLTLSQYDALVLPTHYYTEGFPGSVLDAYIAGIPVVVTRWKHSAEFVADGESGLISDWDDKDDFLKKIRLLYDDRNLLLKLKQGASKKADEYSSEKAFLILKDFISN